MAWQRKFDTISTKKPRLTSLDFVFWNFVNKYICMVKIRNLADLEDRVQEASEQVTCYMLQGAWKEV